MTPQAQRAPYEAARFAARRLRAASRRNHPVLARRAGQIARKLSEVRRYNERAILLGPRPEGSLLASFLSDWRFAIDSECRAASRVAM